MKREKFLKSKLIFISIVILILPDIIINLNQSFLNYSLCIISKLGLLFFLALTLLRITKSYFWTYLILGVPYIFSACIEVGNILILNSFLSLDNVTALFNTTANEISEFFNKFYLFFLIPISILSLYIYTLVKFKKVIFNAQKFNNKLILIAFISIFISFSISFYKATNSPSFQPGYGFVHFIKDKYYVHQHPFNIYWQTYSFSKGFLIKKKYGTQKNKFKFEVKNINDVNQPEIVIFIIGEKIRYHNWSINGYHRETSPNLRKVKSLISFSKHYSNSNNTNISIPLLITQATPKTPKLMRSQKTIVSLFKEAGYETHWISNQNVFNIIDNKVEPDRVYELYKKNNSDLEIISVFDSLINKDSHKKKFITINMIGGHGQIPSIFINFQPNSSKISYPYNSQNSLIFINDYDNMILLQDHVLSEIVRITEIKNVAALLLFTSDHACNLFDEGGTLFGYGSSNPSEVEIHIPLFIWGSNNYNVLNNWKMQNIIRHKDLLTSNDNLFYTIADLANIKYKYFIKEQSIADSFYTEPKSKCLLINGKVVEL